LARGAGWQVLGLGLVERALEGQQGLGAARARAVA